MKISKIISALGFLTVILTGVSFISNHVEATTAQTASGWAWGGTEDVDGLSGAYDGIGWISFNDLNVGSGGGSYGVNVPAGDGPLSGYAWSEHYGWLSFNGADLAECTGPTALGQATRSGNSISGGARFIAIRDAGANAGGFDGCVSLSGAGYGVNVVGSSLNGYAWSSDLGWINFGGNGGNVTIAQLPLSCVAPTTVVLDSKPAINGTNYSNLQALDKVGNYVYAGASGGADVNGLYIYDISDPESITQVSFFSTQNPAFVQNNTWGNDVLGLDVDGNYAYLATQFGGLVIVDVSNPATPSFVGKVALYNLNLPGNRETWDVNVVGNYAFLAAGRGMIVVDVSNKANPVVVKNLDLGTGISQDILASGNYAYVAMRNNGFSIVDISNPSASFEVAHVTAGYDAANWAYSVEKNDNVLYVADHYAQRINLYDVTNPVSPVLVTTIPNLVASDTKSPREIFIESDVLYVGAGRGGVYVFDVTNSANPALLYNVVEPPLNLSLGGVWGVMPLNSADFTRLVFVSTNQTNSIYTTETQCTPIPNLIPTFTLVGPFTVNTPINLTAQVTNNGTAPTPTGFSNNFSYSTDGTNWTDLSPFNVHGVMNDDGSLESDTQTYTPTAAGNLWIQYCVDSNNEIAEGVGEVDNCISQGPFNVVGHPSVNILVSPCDIPAGSNECSTATTNWIFSDATPDYLIKSDTTDDTVYTGPDGNSSNSTTRLMYGPNTLHGYHDNDFVSGHQIGSRTLTVGCADGAQWSHGANSCQFPPSVSVEANPRLIRSGAHTNIEVTVTSPNPTNCSVINATSPSPYSLTGHLGGVAAYSYPAVPTKSIKAKQVVTVECTDTITGLVASKNVTIEVVPTMQEI